MLGNGAHIGRQIAECDVGEAARVCGQERRGERNDLCACDGNDRDRRHQRATSEARYIMNGKNLFLHEQKPLSFKKFIHHKIKVTYYYSTKCIWCQVAFSVIF